MSVALKSQYLFVVAVKPFPVNQSIKYESFLCAFQIFFIFVPIVYMGIVYASFNWIIYGSGNGVSPARFQAIIWNNAMLAYWALANKFQRNSNQNKRNAIQGNEHENVYQ